MVALPWVPARRERKLSLSRRCLIAACYWPTMEQHTPKSATDQHNSSSGLGLVDDFSSQGMPILRLEFCSSCEAPHSNLANNLFASSCDSLRPIIVFSDGDLRGPAC